MNKATTAVIGCVLAASWALAGPPVTTEIPDSAIWTAHVDFEAVTGSAIAKGMLALITAEGAPVPAHEVAQALDGWKNLTNLKSVTLYGSSAAEDDAILVARLKYSQAELRKLANITEDTPRVAHGDHTIYTVILKNKKAPQGVRRHGCFYDAQTVVLGGDLAKVRQALDLLDGRSDAQPLRSDNPLRSMLDPSKGSFALVAVTDTPKMLDAIRARAAEAAAGKPGPRAALLAKSHAVRAEIGEADGNVFATLELTTPTPQDAENVSMIVQGMRALLLLHQNRQKDEGIRKDVFKLVQAVKCGFEGKTVAVEFRYPSEELLALMDKLMALRAAQKAAAEGAKE